MDSRRENHKEFIKNSKFVLKSQQRFKSGKYNLFTVEINKIALSANDDKRIQSIDSVKTYAYGTSKDLVCRKEEVTCNNIMNKYKDV